MRANEAAIANIEWSGAPVSTAAPVTDVDGGTQATWPRTLWDREIHHYPSPGRRGILLAIVVMATITCYYQQYVSGAVSPSILAHFDMSFRFYLTIVVVSSIVGAFASLAASLGDRFGRANIVTFGLLGASLITVAGIPMANSKLQYGGLFALLGLFEGAVLVATPALVRDFSPQVRRGAAIGFWTLGPVVASLIVSVVASSTLGWLHPWQDQFHIAGTVGLVVFLIALLTLRELSPPIRDQLMYSVQEQVVIEARARGIDVEQATASPWRQMLKPNVVVPAIGVSLFLLLYFSAVGVFVIFFTSDFGFSQAKSNGIGNWFWAADAITVVAVGIISDRVGVRKPFMLIGAIGAATMGFIFASMAEHPNTPYVTVIVIVVLLSAFRGFAYAPWMAAFTETLESRNPALVATGLAIWGWILRVAVAVSFLVLPFVVTSSSPIVNYGPRLQAIEAQYGPAVSTARALSAPTAKALAASTGDKAALKAAVLEIMTKEHVTAGVAIDKLLVLKAMPKDDRAYLAAHGRTVIAAKKTAPQEWMHWWWICAGAQILFIPTIFLLVGRWSPARGREDREAHERLVAEERKALATT